MAATDNGKATLMNSSGRHSYYQAHEIKPGKLYLANRDDNTLLILGVEPVIVGDNTAVLVVAQLSGNGFTSDFIVVPGEKFALRSQYILLSEVTLSPTQDIKDWKFTSEAVAPIGSLYSKNGTMSLVAKDSSRNGLFVNCETGAVTMQRMTDCFWTERWSIKQKNDNDQWMSIYSR